MSQEQEIIVPQSELGEVLIQDILEMRAKILMMRHPGLDLRRKPYCVGVDPAKPGDDRTAETVIHMNPED